MLYEIDGVEKSCEAWARHYGISSGTLYNRIHVMGLSAKEAVTMAKGTSRKRRTATMVTIDGETLSVDQWAARSLVDAYTIRKRLQRGMSPRDAVYTPTGRPVALEGSHFIEIAAELGVTKQAVQFCEARAKRKCKNNVRTLTVVRRCDRWMEATGLYISDDAVAEIVAYVLENDSVWELLDSGDLDVADLCRAARKMEEEQSNG